MKHYRILLMAMLLCLLVGGAAMANEQEELRSGDFTYTVQDGEVCITDYLGDATVLTIPEEIDGMPVTHIAYWIPLGENNLTSITIPKHIVRIDEGAFAYCPKLEEILADTEHYVSIDGVLFDKEQIILLACPAARAVPFTIPDGVTHIGRRAFENCSVLPSITIPEGVTSIGDSAFYGNRALHSLTLPDSVTHIGRSAFFNCRGLIEISANGQAYTSIDGVLFDARKKALLTYPRAKEEKAYTIPDGTALIAESAFDQCSNLTSITIPDSVTHIEEGAFSGCTGLTGIFAHNQKYASINGVLFDAQERTLLAYPAAKQEEVYSIPDGIAHIASDAFYRCDNLTGITIPDSVTSMGMFAFFSCEYLTHITIPEGMTRIEGSTFAFCDSLTNVTIPDSVTSIDIDAFYWCENLTLTIATDYLRQYAVDNDIPYTDPAE